MNRLRRHPVFWTQIAMLGLALLGGSWWLWTLRQAAAAKQVRLAEKTRELQALRNRAPAPMDEVAEALAAELARAESAVQTMRRSLHGGGPSDRAWPVRPPPAARTDAYFDLAGFVEQTRERAEALGVGLRPEEHFGFAAHAHGGPEPAFIPAVYQQRLTVEHLLEALLESRPQQILSVQRERPRSPVNGESFPDTGPGAQDFFEMDARLSVRIPGRVETTAYRLVFSGHTAVLRTYMNRLAGDGLPLLVRAVEAEPIAPAAERVPAAVRPLVSPSVMKFTITVEHLDFIPEPAPSI